MTAQEFYETTLRALEKARNDRLWFKTQLKLVGLWFKMKEYSRMHRILKDLHRYVHGVCSVAGEWSGKNEKQTHRPAPEDRPHMPLPHCCHSRFPYAHAHMRTCV